MPAGHDESDAPTFLPPLLKAVPAWHPGAWALPAVTISLGSLVVFALSLAYLSRNALAQTLFRLPFPAAYLAVPAAAVAWLIAVRCRLRPGRIAARLWALTLAVFATGIAIWSVTDPFVVPRGRPFVHALTIAVVLATIVQALRLVKVRPNSSLVQNLAVIGVVATVLGAWPVVWTIESSTIGSERRRLDAYDGDIGRQIEVLRAAQSFKWSQMPKDLEAANAQVAALHAVRVPAWVGDPYVWRAAALLGRDARLKARVTEAIDRVRDAVVSAETPRLSTPEHRYNRDTKTWEKYPEFDRLAATTAGYYVELTRILPEFGERARALGGTDPGPALEQQTLSRSAEIVAWAKSAAPGWSTRWITQIVAPGLGSTTLAEILHLSLPAQQGRSPVRAGQIAHLMALPRSSAERIPSPCILSDYSEPPHAYFRVDCHGYGLSPAGDSATMLGEVRLVYRSIPNGTIAGSATPYQLYYRFPVPVGTTVDAYRPRAMQIFWDTVSELYGTTPTTRRGGPPTEGFTLRTHANGSGLDVTRPNAVAGANANAVEVQVFPMQR